jgi:peptide/nickel transport system substrate-binding protein
VNKQKMTSGSVAAMAKQRMGHEAQGRAHPAVRVLHADLLNGKISRREFLRTATLLGVAAPAAYAMSGAIGADDLIGQAYAATAKAGGVLRVSMEVHALTDPAQFAWSPQANLVRHMCEYLTITGADNVTRPYLAERWAPSDDLKTWTFYLRKGIKWHNDDRS